MSVGNVFFCLCSLVALIGAVGTVISKNPIRSAVALLASILGIAGLFLQLSAQFLAAIQLIVYAGAVVVLFVFVIMVLGPDAVTSSGPESASPRARWSRRLGAVLLVLVALLGGVFAAGINSAPAAFAKVPEGFGGVEGVGRLLFTQGLVPFELATALLIVAVVGAIAVARSHHGARERKVITNPQKLFVGPLHPRDAGRAIPKEGLS